jgi:hypothetical protein
MDTETYDFMPYLSTVQRDCISPRERVREDVSTKIKILWELRVMTADLLTVTLLHYEGAESLS